MIKAFILSKLKKLSVVLSREVIGGLCIFFKDSLRLQCTELNALGEG